MNDKIKKIVEFWVSAPFLKKYNTIGNKKLYELEINKKNKEKRNAAYKAE